MIALIWLCTIVLSGTLGFLGGLIFAGTPDPNRRDHRG